MPLLLEPPFEKHLGLFLDEKLNFGHHVNEKIYKANKIIGLIKMIYYHLPRKSLLNIYKSFVRPHLDYRDVIYDQPNNDALCSRIESVQYNASLAITGAIKGSSREQLYHELGLESLTIVVASLKRNPLVTISCAVLFMLIYEKHSLTILIIQSGLYRASRMIN